MANNNSVERVVDLRKTWAIIRKNWMVLGRDAIRLRTLMMFPLVMIILFGFTAGEIPKHIAAAVVDYDDSNLSKDVQAELYSNQLFSIKHQVGSQDEGRKLIDSGEIKILFIIPQGFSSDIEAGRSASLYVIVDESDPTVAQITRASTQGFIQSLSEQLTVSRIAAISSKAQRFLQSAQSPPAGEKPNEGDIEQIRAEFIDSRYRSMQTDQMLSDSIVRTRNSLGSQLYDPNEIVAEYENYTATRAATYDLLTASDAQQPALAQISSYEGFMAANDRHAQDASSMYSSASSIYASLLRKDRSLLACQKMVDSANLEMGVIAGDAGRASGVAVVYSEIQPYGSGRPGLDFLIPSILATVIFQGAMFGMGRAVAGERQDGSMTRIFLTPTSNVTIVSGTMLFYTLFEIIRASVLVLAAMLLFGVSIKGSLLDILVLIAMYAAGATGVGMILSVLARTQEQYMGLSALITLPTMLLGGVFIPIETMPSYIQAITTVLPITYLADALRGVMIKGFGLGQVVPDILFLVGFAIMTMAISLRLFKRELI